MGLVGPSGKREPWRRGRRLYSCTMRIGRSRIAVLALVVLVLAACGGGAPADSAPSETSDAPRADEGGGSLAGFFGYGEGESEAAQADFRDQEARVQEAIRACMAREGFEYIPIVPPDSAFQVWDEADEEERVRTQGFGITTWFGNEEEFGAGEEWVDPNQEAVETLSDAERQAWYDALWGTEEEQQEGMTSEIDAETGETIYYSEGFGAGCQGEASEAVYGSQDGSQALWEELQPAMEAMYQRVEADPRIVEANSAWASCMAEKGYELGSRNAMWETVHQDFQARLDEIVGPDGGYGDPFEGWSEDEINAFFEEKTQEEIDAFFEEAQAASQADIDQEALSALQQEEIEMAVADFECAQGWNDLYQEVSEAYEADFISENRAILEQIRDAQGG